MSYKKLKAKISLNIKSSFQLVKVYHTRGIFSRSQKIIDKYVRPRK